MRHEFRLADIGEGLEEAEIVRWLVSLGDQVARDQPLVEVMTDKSNAELPAPEAGTVVELSGSVGDVVNVGELIAVIDTGEPSTASVSGAGAAGPAVQAPAAEPDFVGDEAQSTPSGVSDPTTSSPTGAADDSAPRPKASPSTRRIAAERNIDLTVVRGTGPGGRILLSDLDVDPVADTVAHPVADTVAHPVDTSDAGEAQPDGELQSEMIPLRGIRRVVARNMAQSWSEIPHIHAFDEIDAEPLLELRSRLRTSGKPALEAATPLTFFVAAVAKALARYPEANASIDVVNETITQHASVNVGVAVATDTGLVVPVLHGADRLDFAALSAALNELVQAARRGSLTRDDYRHGTVTITNFGALGGRQATPLIRPPESVIFGFGAIAKRPFVVEDRVVARKTLPTVVGTDHRLLDGDVTTAVLQAVGASLADPLGLVL